MARDRGIEHRSRLNGIVRALALRHLDELGGNRSRDVLTQEGQSVDGVAADMERLEMRPETPGQKAGGFDCAFVGGPAAERRENGADRHEFDLSSSGARGVSPPRSFSIRLSSG